MKCDFCEKEAASYGSQCSYQACDEHTEQGEAIESNMYADIERHMCDIIGYTEYDKQLINSVSHEEQMSCLLDYKELHINSPEFLRQT